MSEYETYLCLVPGYIYNVNRFINPKIQIHHGSEFLLPSDKILFNIWIAFETLYRRKYISTVKIFNGNSYTEMFKIFKHFHNFIEKKMFITLIFYLFLSMRNFVKLYNDNSQKNLLGSRAFQRRRQRKLNVFKRITATILLNVYEHAFDKKLKEIHCQFPRNIWL